MRCFPDIKVPNWYLRIGDGKTIYLATKKQLRKYCDSLKKSYFKCKNIYKLTPIITKEHLKVVGGFKIKDFSENKRDKECYV